MRNGGLWGHARHCVPEKTGSTKGSPNLNPTWSLATTQMVVVWVLEAYKVIRVPISVVCCLELQRAPRARRRQ